MKILLIHNYWEWRHFQVLSEVIKAITPRKPRFSRYDLRLAPLEFYESVYAEKEHKDKVANHLAWLDEETNTVHEMRGASLLWMIRFKLGMPVSFAANEGSGYTVTDFEEWKAKHNRLVWVLDVLVEPVEVVIDCGYGIFDLIPSGMMIIRIEHLGIGNHWNGEDGVVLMKGNMCHEYGMKKLGRNDGHRYYPEKVRYLPEVRQAYSFETRKR